MVRGLIVWLSIMGLETLHGTLRAVLLVPRVGETTAALIGWPVGMVIVLLVTYAMIGWTKLRQARWLLALGAIWAGLTFLFEIGIGWLRGLSATAIADEINPFGGGLMLYSLAVMLAAPWLCARLRRITSE